MTYRNIFLGLWIPCFFIAFTKYLSDPAHQNLFFRILLIFIILDVVLCLVKKVDFVSSMIGAFVFTKLLAFCILLITPLTIADSFSTILIGILFGSTWMPIFVEGYFSPTTKTKTKEETTQVEPAT